METVNTIKNEEILAFQERCAEQAEKELNAVIDGHVNELSRIVKAFKTRHEKLTAAVKKKPDDIKSLRDFNTSLLKMLEKYQQNIKDNQQNHILEKYNASLKEVFAELPAIITRRELFEPYGLKTGNLLQLLKKVSINTGFFIRRNGIAFINLFRVIFKRKAKETKIYRTRKLPFRNMAMYYIGDGVKPGMTELVGNFMKLKSSVLYRLWDFNDHIDEGLQNHVSANDSTDLAELFDAEKFNQLFDEINAEVVAAKSEFNGKSKEIVQEAFEKFDVAATRVDTPELAVKTYLKKALTVFSEETNAEFTNTVTRWGNTQITLLDDWMVDVEVIQLYYSVLSDFNVLKKNVGQFVNKHIAEDLEGLSSFINKSAARIEKAAVSAKQEKQTLINERKIINQDFTDKLLTRSIEEISVSYTDDIERFRQNTINLAAKVSAKRGFVHNAKYDRGIHTSEIKYLSPRELLNFEAIPHFQKAVNTVREQVEASLEKAKLKLLSSGTVCDFSLESALMLLDQKKTSYKASQQVATEGYQRAIINIEEASEQIKKIVEQPLSSLQSAIHDFNAEIQKLKNTENILELNIRIVRIRTIERSKKARHEAVQMIKNIVPIAIALAKDKVSQTSGAMDSLKSRIGIATQKKHISYEVSEFISQAEASLKKLPFIYQRLYQIQPTDEDRFFVNRTEEIDMLNNAFEVWLKERYVTTAIIGEKGSGITSLITYFINRLQTDSSIIHQTIEQKISQQEQYFKTFAEILGQESFNSNEEIIAYLNKKQEKPIIIMENMQHAFLKKVGGLDCQRLFFDLMANTAKNVFWVAGYTSNSWEYLDQVIHISDNFVKEVRLQPLGSQSLMEIIYKRNNLSGYKLRFEPTEEDAETRWYKKADEKERNRILRKNFFNNLALWSNGNVSLSQLYWLHSTRDVSEDTINIGSSIDIDLSFVKTIKAEYLFALHAILIHDGLTLKAYSEVFSQSESQSRNMLIPMLEKGLLIRPREKFNINPIVFRQVINLLRSRNFIS